MIGQRTRVYYLLTLLILIVLGSFSLAALTKFFQYQKVVAPNIELTMDRFHFFLQNELKSKWIKIITPKPLKDEDSPLKTFRISVRQSDLDSLNVNLPESGRDHFVDAYMLTSDDQQTRKIKLRYRGDNLFHWFYTQKSLRIKLGKNDIYNMEKSFNLINPPMMATFRDYVYYSISRELGLIAPDFFPVRVFINGQYMGVYMYLSQVNESLLRKRKLMPGSIYNGDGSPDLWFKAGEWKKKAARNKEQKNNREDIDSFIRLVNDKTDNDFYSFVNIYLNKSKWFTYIALDRLFGSNHHDMSHNHKIFFDPYKGKFQPVAWDLRFWQHINIKDMSLYPLLLRLKANPYYDAEIDKVLFELLENGYVEKSLRLYEDTMVMSRKDLESDPYKDTSTWLPYFFGHPPWYSLPFSLEDLARQFQSDKDALTKRKLFLYETLADTQVSVLLDDNQKTLYLRIDGNSPVRFGFKGEGKINYTVSNNGEIIQNVGNVLYPGRKWALGRLSYDTITMKNNVIEHVPVVYGLTVDGLDSAEALSKIQFSNYITGKKIDWKKGEFDINASESDVNPYEFFPPPTAKQILSGVIDVDKDMIFSEHVTVEIKSGTVFRMDPGTSIFFYGKVVAQGTEERPIQFIAKDEAKPWGLVAVQGKAASGSIFTFCEFQNGSTATRNLIHYTAPFNIHDVDGFELRNCRFGKNSIGDDSAHIAYSSGIIDNCLFENARSDGLDIDIADVILTNSVFINSGNDGLDIMTTKAEVSNNLFMNTGDKGASVGEWSEAEFVNNIFINNEIGLEVKDKSRVNGTNLLFVDARKKAINLYNKNKRYDEGGFFQGKNVIVLGNDKVKADRKSHVRVKPGTVLSREAQRQFLNFIPDGQCQGAVEEATNAYVQ